MRWAELDTNLGIWTLPGARTKNRREHLLPLVPAALTLLPHPQNGRDFLFGDGPRRSGTRIVGLGWSKSKTALDARIAEALGEPLPHWTVHDLRRSRPRRWSIGLACCHTSWRRPQTTSAATGRALPGYKPRAVCDRDARGASALGAARCGPDSPKAGQGCSLIADSGLSPTGVPTGCWFHSWPRSWPAINGFKSGT